MDTTLNKNFSYPKHLKLLVTALTTLFLLFGIVVYFLKQMAFFSKLSETEGPISIELFYKHSGKTIFWIIPYNWITATIFTFLQFNSFIVFIFTDILLISISLILANRFQQLSKTLTKRQKIPQFHPDNASFWKNVRKDYCKLSSLLFLIDDHISLAIIFSYCLNFFSLLRFLTKLLRDSEQNLIVKFHDYCDALNFTLRIICLTLFSSWINEASQEPVAILNSVVEREYSAEVGRLLLQIGFDEVALTGCKMFKLNKGLFLNIVSAIVTYELIVIQYNNN
ncbi:gustatory receptor 4 [Tribolium castaneum]|uniref:Gustatory receptor 4 n=1 Tax=Tribolium castaneum TaxID=7070 RepID=D6WK64_TRICA|nr:gustatory receptor 4 [Tribolium castaneum]